MLDLTLFAERLDDLMFDNGINAPALAKAIAVDRTTITRYLQGNKIPSVKNVILLADYFKCTADFLLGLAAENYSNTFRECPPFSERFPFLLEYFKINKYQLQKQSKIPESLIYNWQRGQYSPTIDNVIKMAEVFDCTVDFVLGRSN